MSEYPEQFLPEDVDREDADEELHALTDEEWREKHEALRGVIPEEELEYTWAPGKSPEELGL